MLFHGYARGELHTTIGSRIVGFDGVGHEQIAVVRPNAWRREVDSFLSALYQ